mmetsp:Transcript_6715/g.19385  ORF Transcript_6715/g.19385 Transcript_6715/m.19385 type:complete len:544 (+) Transcript_6715:2754-4385(+)
MKTKTNIEIITEPRSSSDRNILPNSRDESLDTTASGQPRMTTTTMLPKTTSNFGFSFCPTNQPAKTATPPNRPSLRHHSGPSWMSGPTMPRTSASRWEPPPGIPSSTRTFTWIPNPTVPVRPFWTGCPGRARPCPLWNPSIPWHWEFPLTRTLSRTRWTFPPWSRSSSREPTRLFRRAGRWETAPSAACSTDPSGGTWSSSLTTRSSSTPPTTGSRWRLWPSRRPSSRRSRPRRRRPSTARQTAPRPRAPTSTRTPTWTSPTSTRATRISSPLGGESASVPRPGPLAARTRRPPGPSNTPSSSRTASRTETTSAAALRAFLGTAWRAPFPCPPVGAAATGPGQKRRLRPTTKTATMKTKTTRKTTSGPKPALMPGEETRNTSRKWPSCWPCKSGLAKPKHRTCGAPRASPGRPRLPGEPTTRSGPPLPGPKRRGSNTTTCEPRVEPAAVESHRATTNFRLPDWISKSCRRNATRTTTPSCTKPTNRNWKPPTRAAVAYTRPHPSLPTSARLFPRRTDPPGKSVRPLRSRPCAGSSAGWSVPAT